MKITKTAAYQSKDGAVHSTRFAAVERNVRLDLQAGIKTGLAPGVTSATLQDCASAILKNPNVFAKLLSDYRGELTRANKVSPTQ